MSEVSFTISYESTEMIISFVKFILENTRYNMNIRECDKRLSEIENEMKKYKNKECDVVIELCQKIKGNVYFCRLSTMLDLSNFIQAVKPIIDDEIFEKLIHETLN